ncbi:MAG: hypothetical protein HC903_12695 [Methylacidiphilales bacterium]|nr:hypothetical protein [Candidatus Methylacidiphilales bacterium]NJR18067.1 hypothetical protein [Calothrix sp. CSU_2_0]
MTERLESVKAAILSAFCLALMFSFTTFANNQLFAKSFLGIEPLEQKQLRIDFLGSHWWISAGIAAFSGFLFGITYRYIIRTNNNQQLKSGGIMAFGLVRGLAQVDVGIRYTSNIVPLVVVAGESILWFGLAALILDLFMQLGWIQRFESN